MLFDKPKILIFLKRQSLLVVDGEGKIHTIQFPQEVVRDLEIVNHGNFVKLVSDLVKSIKAVKVEAIVIFAKEVIFEKLIDVSSGGSDELKESFFAQVPFDRESLLKKVIEEQKGVRLVCANGDFIKTLRLAFREFGIHITVAVPATIFAISASGNALSVADALAISRNKLALDKGNFLVQEAQRKEKNEDSEKEDRELAPEDIKNKPWRNQKVLLVFGIALIVGAVVIVAFGLGLVKNPFTKVKPKASPSVQSKLQTSPSSKVSKNIQKAQSKEATGEASVSAKEASASPLLVP